MKMKFPELKGVSGIYCFLHVATNRRYIGCAVNVLKRMHQHWNAVDRGSLTGFHKALREFGKEGFEFSLLEKCEQPQLLIREAFWIEFYDSASTKGFNVRKFETYTPYGLERNEATLARMREASKRRPPPKPVSEETRLAMSIARTGTKRSLATKAKISAKQIGRYMSPETRAKIGEANRGRKMSEEFCKRQSRIRKGMKFTDEHCANMSKAAKGKVKTPEHCANISKAHKGRTLSPELRTKMSIAQKLRQEKIKAGIPVA